MSAALAGITIKIIDEQMWYLKYISKDTYTIRQQKREQYLDAHTDRGHDFNVVTRPAQHNNSQRWMLKRTDRVLKKVRIYLNKCCKNNFDSNFKAMLNGKSALDWVCQTNNGISAKKSCQQHSTNKAGYTERSNPYSWYCNK